MHGIHDSGLRALAVPYLMSAALVYVVSLTNPFLTNPIGMSVVMIAMVAVRVINRSSSKDLMEPCRVQYNILLKKPKRWW